MDLAPLATVHCCWAHEWAEHVERQEAAEALRVWAEDWERAIRHYDFELAPPSSRERAVVVSPPVGGGSPTTSEEAA